MTEWPLNDLPLSVKVDTLPGDVTPGSLLLPCSFVRNVIIPTERVRLIVVRNHPFWVEERYEVYGVWRISLWYISGEIILWRMCRRLGNCIDSETRVVIRKDKVRLTTYFITSGNLISFDFKRKSYVLLFSKGGSWYLVK